MSEYSEAYDELLEEYRMDQRYLCAYRKFVNEIDDYFEYRCESKKDQQKVHQLLQNLTERLCGLVEELDYENTK